MDSDSVHPTMMLLLIDVHEDLAQRLNCPNAVRLMIMYINAYLLL